jgi:hypothetical protein
MAEPRFLRVPWGNPFFGTTTLADRSQGPV